MHRKRVFSFAKKQFYSLTAKLSWIIYSFARTQIQVLGFIFFKKSTDKNYRVWRLREKNKGIPIVEPLSGTRGNLSGLALAEVDLKSPLQMYEIISKRQDK